MTFILGRSLALVAALCLGTACTQSDAAKVSQKPESAAAMTANGSLATAGAAGARDSITDKADRGRIAGDTSAKVWVIMISDFQCPYCKQWHDAYFAPLMRDYVNTKKVQMAFINFPLGMHPNAVPAAEAAMCASVQNKFWPMHDALFAAQDQWAPLPDPSAKLAEIAGKIPGLDMNRWKTCVAQHQTLPLIQADRDRARQAGAQSTPTFVVGGQLLAGSDKDLKAEIEAALKAAAKR
jgi:protein-disulfide isomerase